MLKVLEAIWQQIEETYEAIDISIGSAGSRIGWKPDGDISTFAEIAQHIASANLSYCTVIGPENVRRIWQIEASPEIGVLLGRLKDSLSIVQNTFERVTLDNLHDCRCDDWSPNCDEQNIQGPLDTLWFALQILRHTAYHLGQLNSYLQLMHA